LSEKKLRIVLPIAIIAIGFIITIILIKSRPPVPTRTRREYAPVVRAITVNKILHTIYIPSQGTVRPRTESNLVAEVAGKVIELSPVLASGGFFERGDVLLTIDPRDYESALTIARGQFAKVKLAFETEKAQAKIARDEWAEMGNGSLSPLATRELQVEEAKSALASANAALERAKRDLERTRISVPFTGRVKSKLVDLGQYVAPGTPVAAVYATDYAEIRLPVPDSDLAYLELPGDMSGENRVTNEPAVTLSADFAGKRREWNGRIVRVEGEIDPLTRMVYVVAQVDEPYGDGASVDRIPLAAGLFVEAEIKGITIADAVIIPRAALRPDSTVLVVDNENHLRFRKIDIFRMGRSDVIVIGGLQSGEKICISSLDAVSDGMKVRIFSSGRAHPAQTDSSNSDDLKPGAGE